MASKQVKLQQRNKHPRAVSKILAPNTQACSSDAWSFLELIDAPQWADLSLEAGLMGKEGFDSWFERSHKHHVMSLAGFNTSMSWLGLGKLNQKCKGPILSKGCRIETNKPEKNQSGEHLNRLVRGQNQPQSQTMGLRVQKAACYSNSTGRGCNARGLYGSVETGCSFSGRSSTSECETSGFLKKRSLCSDRSSVSSSLQACSVEVKKFPSSGLSGSSSVNQSEDFHDTPTSCSGHAHRSRNSSSASYCPPMVKSRYSSDVGVSNCTKSSELCVSTGANVQFVCEADLQSSGDSVVTSVSGVSNALEDQGGKGCGTTVEEAADGLRKMDVSKDGMDYIEPLARDLIAGFKTLNGNLSHGQQMAKDDVKSGIKAGRQRLTMKVSHVVSLPRKQLCTGKENAPPKESLSQASFEQAKDKPFHCKGPFAAARSKTASGRTDGLSLGVGFHTSQVRKKEGLLCASQAIPWKSAGLQNSNRDCSSSIAHQRKRYEAKQIPVKCENTRESERDLAALVAQHNQKIRSLQWQNLRKGLR